MTTRSEYGFDPAPTIIHKFGHRLHDIEPLLETETFVLDDVDGVSGHLGQGLLPRLIALGGLTIDEYRRDRGTRYCQYRWVEGVNEALQAYLDGRETLPCGHRWHIYNPPDSEPDELGCKFCDDTHSKAAVRARRGRGGDDA